MPHSPRPFCRAQKVFHTMENFFAIFPHYGKNVSTLWKTFFPPPHFPRPLSAGRGCRGFLSDFDGPSRKNNRQIFRRCRFAGDPSWTPVRERSNAERQNGKDAGWFVRRQNPKEILSPKLSPLFTLLALATTLLLLPLLASPASAGWLEQTPSGPALNLTLFDLPDASRTDPSTRAELAVQRAFLAQAPDRLRARQAAAPGRYGPLDLSSLSLRLHRFSGIQVEGIESTLLAIAGNVACMAAASMRRRTRSRCS